MADVDSSLPIRTETAGDVIAKIADATTPSQQLAVNSDGSINITDNGGTITVDGTVTVTATNLDIRDLAFATDKVDVSGSSVTATATDLDIRDLAFATDKVDVSGSSVTVTATDLDIRNLSAAQDNVRISDGTDNLAINADGSLNATVSATNLDIRDLAFATDKVDVTGSSVTVSATDLDIRNLSATQDNVSISDGTDSLAVNADGSINVVVQGGVGTDVVNYNTASSLAANATSNHDVLFTNAGELHQVLASASGKMKAEVQIETGSATNVFNTTLVGFNSTANPNIDLPLTKPAAIPAGARVRVIRTNLDNQAQNVYSTIVGFES